MSKTVLLIIVAGFILLALPSISSASVQITVNGSIEDNSVYSNTPDTVMFTGGADDNLYVGTYQGAKNYRGYIKFTPFAGIPAGATILNSTYCLFGWETSPNTYDVESHHVYPQIWDESLITWNDAPCSGGALNASCNSTSGSTISIDSTNNVWRCWDSTNGVQYDWINSKPNVSFVLKLTLENQTPNVYKEFRSSENTGGLKPFLNITYDEPTTTTSSTTTSTTSSTTTEETTTTIENWAYNCSENCSENPFSYVGSDCLTCIEDFERDYSCSEICGEASVCDPPYWCQEYLQFGYKCGCCCEQLTTTTIETTTTACPSPTGRCCFIGDVSGNCCLDANFLYTQKEYMVNGTLYSYNETLFCSNGCDSVLNICQPTESMTLIYVVVLIIMGVLAWILLKKLIK